MRRERAVSKVTMPVSAGLAAIMIRATFRAASVWLDNPRYRRSHGQERRSRGSGALHPDIPRGYGSAAARSGYTEDTVRRQGLLTLSRLHEKKGLGTILNAIKDSPGCVAWLAAMGLCRRSLRSWPLIWGLPSGFAFLDGARTAPRYCEPQTSASALEVRAFRHRDP